MNQYCTKTNLPSIILDYSILTREKEEYATLATSYINPQVVEIIGQRGFNIYSVEIFKTGPTNPMWSVHVDGPIEGDMAKINWVYGNINCDMVWYKQKLNTTTKSNNTAVGPYLEYNISDVDEVARFNIGVNAIVQTGVPHTVINSSNQDRYCVSVNLSNKFSTCIPYAYTVEMFKDFIV
jgi:hypothetical protein